MNPRQTRKIKASLLKKGFVEDTESHHHYFTLYINGRKSSVYTYFSHGQKEVGAKILGSMAKQLGLTVSDFEKLIDCPLGKSEYINILKHSRRVKGT